MGIFRPYNPSSGQRSDRSAGDRLRHRQKVREAVRDNIGNIIAEESIIGKDRNRVVKVPIRSVKEYRFVYGENVPGVGQGGEGDVQPGQTVGKGKQGAQGQQAGDQPGVDYYETEFLLEELIDVLFEDLELPEMARKQLKNIEVETVHKLKGHRKKGIWARLDKRKTAINRVKRKKAHEAIEEPMEVYHNGAIDAMPQSEKERFPFHEKDLKFKHMVADTKEESNAVVLCIMDTSGSMDTMKKYLARSFFFLLSRFVMTRYVNVEIVFIAHHTEAREVTEEEFFHKGESGGTFISSGYIKALEIIKDRYDPHLWNIYAFHCSDGDNFESDNQTALKSARELAEISNLFGYGEIKPLGAGYYGGSMIQFFSQINAPNFQTVQIEKKEDIWKSFETFLKKDKAEIGVNL